MYVKLLQNLEFILKGEVEMLKKAINSGILFSSILLVGCKGEPEGEPQYLDGKHLFVS